MEGEDWVLGNTSSTRSPGLKFLGWNPRQHSGAAAKKIKVTERAVHRSLSHTARPGYLPPRRLREKAQGQSAERFFEEIRVKEEEGRERSPLKFQDLAPKDCDWKPQLSPQAKGRLRTSSPSSCRDAENPGDRSTTYQPHFQPSGCLPGAGDRLQLTWPFGGGGVLRSLRLVQWYPECRSLAGSGDATGPPTPPRPPPPTKAPSPGLLPPTGPSPPLLHSLPLSPIAQGASFPTASASSSPRGALGRLTNASHRSHPGGSWKIMAQFQGDVNPLSKQDKPTKLNASSALQIRSYRTDICSLGRYKSQAVADSATLSREPIIHSTLMVTGLSGTRRRGALRELLGLRGAAPAGWRSEERLELASPASRRSSGQGSSRMCLEPREHTWILAAAEGRFEVLLELLEAEPSLLMRDDPITGYSVLHWLAKHGCHEELILLHDFAQRRGLPFDVSAPGSGGLTPLHLAALQGHDMVIKVLVGALGADPTRRDYSGHRPCHYLRPNASRSLQELSGAEEWEMARDKEHSKECDDANNNSTTTTGWSLNPTPSVTCLKSMGIRCKEVTQSAKEKKASGHQRGQGNGLLRHLFSFIQDR